MQITLNEEEIKSAIKGYIKEQGLNFDCSPEISFTAGRGSTGLTASIELTDIKLASTVPEAGRKEVPTEDPVTTKAEKEQVEETVKPKAAKKKAKKKKSDEVFEEPKEEEITPDAEDSTLFGSDPEEVTSDTLFAS